MQTRQGTKRQALLWD